MLFFLKKIPSFISEIIIILILSALTGLTVLKFTKTGFSLNEQETHSKQNKFPEIDIYQAKKAFELKTAVFLDSREHKDYQKGHIKGAINLPSDKLDDNAVFFLEKYQDKNQPFIIYCDGEDCNLSRLAAEFLINIGYTHIEILKNGWTLWNENNLPSEWE
ncbi:MAG: hypothetical protein CSB21_02710 [Deltaproteobacteria bacterium]|nr:MAG: hypothetical protein CSB21_02710 [Deltaproteobacteria bacterium]